MINICPCGKDKNIAEHDAAIRRGFGFFLERNSPAGRNAFRLLRPARYKMAFGPGGFQLTFQNFDFAPDGFEFGFLALDEGLGDAGFLTI